jgi:hypothetical protein
MMDYAGFLNALSVETEIATADANFVAILPTIISDAELRCYRELNLLSTVVVDKSSTVTANSRNFTLPLSIGKFIEVLEFNVFTPVGSQTTRNQAVQSSVPSINYFWPSDVAPSSVSTPKLWARLDDNTLLLGPAPGASFTAEVRGTVRPTPLSSTNTTSWLSLYAYDLFFAAAMCSMCGYMRNWGAQGDDPKMGQSWETQYQTRFASVNAEEMQKKFGGQ